MLMKVADRVYDELRRAIVEGKYKPHQRLVESDLADDLAASRTPIRQSLQRLELEGLVFASRNGWVVREHSVLDIQRVYDVRIPLEGYAARLAAERATDQQLRHLEELHRSVSERMSPDNRIEFVKLHDELHDAIFVAAGNEVLRDAVLGYRQHPYNMRVAHLYSEGELTAAAKSHEELVQAICARDADLAEALARDHLALSREATLQRLKQFL
ncbi:GntR family transcriptional regulator [Jiangella ureilytica]|uniref:GntR family transcriptional regulator n=1 Tax=Jiangella ureilytica TaxID=2530374 RepID=A0A4R4RT13_9ACTN|nr:GntR family transcriptional regulator [Jiangella ureilytica]TDC52774.1 GntR family transcriptional regulator [Jiangella ureilytica]